MQLTLAITAPEGDDDYEGAQRVMQDFVFIYRGTLVKIDQYLDDLIEDAGPDFSGGYVPWQKSLHDLLVGVYLLSKKIPLPNTEDFIDSLRIFSFSAAIEFIYDLCVACQIKLEQEWQEHFWKHVQMVMHAFQILSKHMEKETAIGL